MANKIEAAVRANSGLIAEKILAGEKEDGEDDATKPQRREVAFPLPVKRERVPSLEAQRQAVRGLLWRAKLALTGSRDAFRVAWPG